MQTKLGKGRGAANPALHGHDKDQHRAEKQLATVVEGGQADREPGADNDQALRAAAAAAAQGYPHRQPGPANARRRVPKRVHTRHSATVGHDQVRAAGIRLILCFTPDLYSI